MSDLAELKRRANANEETGSLLESYMALSGYAAALEAKVERLQAILRTLLGLHDAEVFVKEPWDTTFQEARATLEAS